MSSNNYNQLILYGHYYNNGKLHIKNIKSDFDIIRELEKFHKEYVKIKNIQYKYYIQEENLMRFKYSDTLFFLFE